MRYGNQINFTTGLYRSYLSVLGVKTGKWKKLPAIKYVNVFPEHFAQSAWVNSAGADCQYKKLKVMLVVNKQIHFDVGVFQNKEEAMKTAKMVAGSLNIKLLDYKSKEPRRVDISS